MTAIWVGPAAPGNFGLLRGGTAIDRIVCHWTTGSLDSAIAQFRNPAAGTSAHFIIDRDGLLYQMVQTYDTAYHAGSYPINLRSVGIEHVGGPQYDGFTDEQYAVSSDLCSEIAEDNGFPVDRVHVIGHREVPYATQCPGVLDLERIVGGNMTDAQMAELKAFISAQTTISVNAAVAIALRQMRGANPGLAGNDVPLVAGEHIYPDHAV